MNLLVESLSMFPNSGAAHPLSLSVFRVMKGSCTFSIEGGDKVWLLSLALSLLLEGMSLDKRATVISPVSVSFSLVVNMANLLRGDSMVLLVVCFLCGVKFWKRSSIAESDNRLKLND